MRELTRFRLSFSAERMAFSLAVLLASSSLAILKGWGEECESYLILLSLWATISCSSCMLGIYYMALAYGMVVCFMAWNRAG